MVENPAWIARHTAGLSTKLSRFHIFVSLSHMGGAPIYIGSDGECNTYMDEILSVLALSRLELEIKE